MSYRKYRLTSNEINIFKAFVKGYLNNIWSNWTKQNKSFNNNALNDINDRD